MTIWEALLWMSKLNFFSIESIKSLLVLLCFIFILVCRNREVIRTLGMYSVLIVSVVQADMPVYKIVVGPVPGYTGATAKDYASTPGWQFTLELACRVEQAIGHKIEVEFINSWSRANYMFRQAHIDVLFPEIVGDTTQPGITGTLVGKGNGFSFYVNVNANKKIRTWKDLEGAVVATLRGRFYPPELLNNSKIIFQEINTPEQAFKMLEAERVDLVAENPFIAQALIKELDLKKEIEAIELIDSNQHNKVFANHYIAYRFHADTQGIKLLESFNIEIGEMLASGVYQDIFADVPQAFSGLSTSNHNKASADSKKRCYKNG